MDKNVLEKIGKKETSSLVKFLEEDGGGFMASYEMSHQLHCLVSLLSMLPSQIPIAFQNLLRKYTYREYYQDSDNSFHDKADTFRAHLGTYILLLHILALIN